MFFREINQDIRVSLTVPHYADELYALTEKNRAYLGRWLPWLDQVQEPGDTRSFIRTQLARFTRSEALHETIFYRNRIVGVLGYNLIDNDNGIGQAGYWLGQEFTGKGIMTLAVEDLTRLGFEYLGLQKVEIRCAVENVKSRAIPQRLGFQEEGLIRRGEMVDGRPLDHVLYGLLKEELAEPGA
jgi:ribosomal-protein-serine acetyltransferase